MHVPTHSFPMDFFTNLDTMENLRLKPRKSPDEIVENWDDDDFMIGDDEDLTFRSHSTTATSTNNHPNTRPRDSRRSSIRSDHELAQSEEQHVHLPGDDEKSTLDAIAAATHAGIPIPTNVPPSALIGGTIKRLGGRKIKQVFQEDWGDELELPASGQALRLRAQDGIAFPEVLRQVSGSTNPSPARKFLPNLAQFSPPRLGKPMSLGAPINLERFRDTDDEDDFFGNDPAMIKVSKLQNRGRPISLITPPSPSLFTRRSKEIDEECFEIDLELPSDGKLKLSSRRDIPKTPSLHPYDEFDWGEGSLGTRFGGTRRGAFSTRSSSVSAMSPSLASSFTAESEDEFFLDGLVIPNGPLDLKERLKRQKQSRSPERSDPNQIRSPGRSGTKIPQQINKQPSSPKIVSPRRYSPQSASPKPRSPRHVLASRIQANKDEDDLVSGLDFGEDNIFRFAKPTVHRNVKVKEARLSSPARPKAAVSITFTNKPLNVVTSRIPRPMASHERAHPQSSLEPVYENGATVPQKPPRRPPSRLCGHSANSSSSSLHTSVTQSSARSTLPPPSPPRRRGQQSTTGALRTEPVATTNAQLLRLKRSLPALRHAQLPAKPQTRTDRPPSGGDSRPDAYRPQSFRPRTPVERPRAVYESNATQAKKVQVPFLPPGVSQAQSHNVNAKGPRSFKRRDSDQGPEIRPVSRGLSRNTIRSPSPRRFKNEKSTPEPASPRRFKIEKSAPEPAWQQINKPRRVRHFGDGHELDVFDDLPTSAQTESRYVKQPIASGIKTNVRNKILQNVLSDRSTPSPVSQYSPARFDSQPHFARDTASSRIARETSLAQRTQPTTNALVTLTSQRVAQLSSRANIKPLVPLHRNRSKKPRKAPQLKPHLISNLNSAKDSKVVNGMTYNPTTFLWEGNENVLNAFDHKSPSPSITPQPQSVVRDKDTAAPRPVLITNINTKKETRRIGDMVFDPLNMCWLKVESLGPNNQHDDSLAGYTAVEEEDPFQDIPDLEDRVTSTNGPGRVSDIREDWLVGEEFDVGPEFVRRQHEEEARWRRKCEKWTGKVSRSRTDWRWAIRDIVMQGP